MTIITSRRVGLGCYQDKKTFQCCTTQFGAFTPMSNHRAVFSGKEVTSLIIEMTCHPGKKKMLGERKQKGSSNRNIRIFIIVGQHLLDVINRKMRLVCTWTSKSRLCSMSSLSFSRVFERECTGQQIVLHQGQRSLRSEAAAFVTCSPSPDRRHTWSS